MKHSIFLCIAITALMLGACTPQTSGRTGFISQQTVQQTIDALKEMHPVHDAVRIERGVTQAAALWIAEDGSASDFKQFVLDNFVNDEAERERLFFSISMHFEILLGHLNRMNQQMMRPLHLHLGEITKIDVLMGGFNPFAHLTNDLFNNKFAFIAVLNFPSYTLEEMETYGYNWTDRQWAYARVSDMFSSRVPAEISQAISAANSAGSRYISEYNIFMGNLLNEQGETLFPEYMRLISHWGLRDQLRTYYGRNMSPEGLEKQEMIYQVMRRIIEQAIPEIVINNPDVQWKPFSNRVFENGVEINARPEPNTRYVHYLNNFRALSAADRYTNSTFIQRSFDEGREMSLDDVRTLFIELLSSPQVKQVADIIRQRVGRDLQPFDIWYDGFKPRSVMSLDYLNSITRRRFPNAQAFEDAMPAMLMQFGWNRADAESISRRIHVDASRGAGHAWRALMRGEQALLRTRIHADGMDYQGFNIAIHELGHNVEQVISLYYVPYWILYGIPTVAFTEALAFAFQRRDMELLGIADENPDADAMLVLDSFWAAFEIMGVSLVDMAVWEWLYANPNTSVERFKENKIRIAKEVWNAYFAPAFGVSDSPILAIYSHAITNPLYLSSYPLGRVIEFQIGEYMTHETFAEEVTRMFSMGRLTPQVWMHRAVGDELSVQPLLRATDEAVRKMSR